jgi:hypothetical protein
MLCLVDISEPECCHRAQPESARGVEHEVEPSELVEAPFGQWLAADPGGDDREVALAGLQRLALVRRSADVAAHHRSEREEARYQQSDRSSFAHVSHRRPPAAE